MRNMREMYSKIKWMPVWLQRAVMSWLVIAPSAEDRGDRVAGWIPWGSHAAEWMGSGAKPDNATSFLARISQGEVMLHEIEQQIGAEMESEVVSYYHGSRVRVPEYLKGRAEAYGAGEPREPWRRPTRLELEAVAGNPPGWGAVAVSVDGWKSNWQDPEMIIWAGTECRTLLITDDVELVHDVFGGKQPMPQELLAQTWGEGSNGLAHLTIDQFEDWVDDEERRDLLRNCHHILVGGVGENEAARQRIAGIWCDLNQINGAGAVEASLVEWMDEMPPKMVFDLGHEELAWVAQLG